jgi:hypothetical protein
LKERGKEDSWQSAKPVGSKRDKTMETRMVEREGEKKYDLRFEKSGKQLYFYQEQSA